MCNQKMSMLGIDIGTTSCSVAVWKNEQVNIIANDQGSSRIPSCVAFTETDYLVGEKAKEQMEMNPKNTIYDLKQLIGRDFRDPNFQSDIKNRPFVVTNFMNKSKIIVDHHDIKKAFFPEEIISLILAELKKRALVLFGKPNQNTVVTVPVCFNYTQRQALVVAGTLANLNVLSVMDAPTAAALAYGFVERPPGERIVLIFDVGGGTTDVSIVKIKDGLSFVVKSTAGDIYLGGEDIDTILVNYFCAEFKKKFDKNLKLYPQALRRLRTEAVRAKHELSTNTRATIFINSLVEGVKYKIDYHTEITREEFNCLCADLFERALVTIKNAMADAKISIESIDDVVLVGGSTRIPKIQSMVQDYFHGKQLTLRNKSEELGAYGAAIQATLLSRRQSESELRFVCLTDVLPFSMSVLVHPEVYMRIMESTDPKFKKREWTSIKEFTTTTDNQQAIEFLIYTDKNKTINQNNLFGKFRLCGIRPAPAGVPRIQVTFKMTARGLFSLNAIDYHNSFQYSIIKLEGAEQNYFDKQMFQVCKLNLRTLKEDNLKKKGFISRKNSLNEEPEEKYLVVKKEEENYEFDQDDKDKIIKIFEETGKWLEDEKVTEQEVYIDKFMEVEKKCTSIMEKKYKESGTAKKELKDYILLIKRIINDDCSMMTQDKKNQVNELVKIAEEWIHANELVNEKKNFVCMLDVTKTLINPIVTEEEMERIELKNELVSYINSLKESLEKRRKYKIKGSKKLVTVIEQAEKWLKVNGVIANKETFREKLRILEEEHNMAIAGSDKIASKALMMVNNLGMKRKFNNVNRLQMPGIYVNEKTEEKIESPQVKRIKYDDELKNDVSVKIEEDERLENETLGKQETLEEQVQENPNLMDEITNVSIKIEKDEFGEEEKFEKEIQEN